MDTQQDTQRAAEFNDLPYEIRHMIWRETFEPKMVCFSPRRDLLSYRGGLPKIAQVNHESRQEFLRHQIRLFDEKSGSDQTEESQAKRQPCEYVFLNPDIDTLILGCDTKIRMAPDDRDQVTIGSQVNTGAKIVIQGHIEAPIMDQGARGLTRKIRLHDFDAYQRLCDMALYQSPQFPRAALPEDLYFPNLDSVWITSISSLFGLPGNAKQAIHFKYIVPTDEVYARPRIDRLEDGVEGFREIAINGQDLVDNTDWWTIRLDIIREDDYSWWDEEWVRPEDMPQEEEGAVFSYAELWQLTVDYLVFRLPSDQ